MSFPEALHATAKQKAEAASARTVASGSDKPRDVILASCEAVAFNLQPEGFTFAKSGPRFRRVLGDLTYSIPIQSDRNNIAGRRAAVWVHAGIYSAELAKARRARPMPWGGDDGPDAGLVTGGQIGNLLLQPTWMEWDFANEETRPDEIAALIGSIRQIVLPFFALFGDPQAAVELLIHRPALSPASLIQYALVVAGRGGSRRGWERIS